MKTKKLKNQNLRLKKEYKSLQFRYRRMSEMLGMATEVIEFEYKKPSVLKQIEDVFNNGKC
jgi:hypothetical protein